jgi:hypothetical protein
VAAVPFAHVLGRLIGAESEPPLTCSSVLTSTLLGMPHRLPHAATVPLDTASDLQDDYLVPELKAAFRRLARRLHPMHRTARSPSARS